MAPAVPINNLGEAVGSGVATLGLSAYMGQTGSDTRAGQIGEGGGLLKERWLKRQYLNRFPPDRAYDRPPAQQSAINEMGEAHGCHTCGADSPGTKSGNWVGDHQPETALNPPRESQIYKPQCLNAAVDREVR